MLLPAVGGYWFVTHFNLTRFQAVRESGYHILFRSVLFGIFWYCIAAAPVWFLDAGDLWGVPSAIKWWDSVFPQAFTIETVVAIVLGVLSPYVLNVFYSKDRGLRRTAESAGDHMELLISDALRNQSPIEVSLRSRKLYIGFVMAQNATRHSDMAVSLFPVYSGHRTEDNLNLVIDIDYSHTLRRFLEQEAEWKHWSPNDLRIIIPVGEIVSARQFDQAVYRAFQSALTSFENHDPDSSAQFRSTNPLTIGPRVLGSLQKKLAELFFLKRRQC